jgi:hypothetical protein
MCPKIDVMERECKNYNIWKRSKRDLRSKHKKSHRPRTVRQKEPIESPEATRQDKKEQVRTHHNGTATQHARTRELGKGGSRGAMHQATGDQITDLGVGVLRLDRGPELGDLEPLAFPRRSASSGARHDHPSSAASSIQQR